MGWKLPWWLSAAYNFIVAAKWFFLFLATAAVLFQVVGTELLEMRKSRAASLKESYELVVEQQQNWFDVAKRHAPLFPNDGSAPSDQSLDELASVAWAITETLPEVEADSAEVDAVSVQYRDALLDLYQALTSYQHSADSASELIVAIDNVDTAAKDYADEVTPRFRSFWPSLRHVW